MAERLGIFIRTQEENVNVIIEACVKLLRTLGLDEKSIKGARENHDHGGHRIYFQDNSTADIFLKHKFLPLTDKCATIHSLTTKLIIHDIFPIAADEAAFEEMIREKLESLQLRPVLNVCFIPISSQYPNIQSGDWKAEVGIPEIEDLDVFIGNGLPDCMKLSLPFENNATNQLRRVSYFCSLCCNKEHSRQRCSNLKDHFMSQVSDSAIPSNASLTSTNSLKIERRDDAQIDEITPKSFKRKITNEESLQKIKDDNDSSKKLQLNDEVIYDTNLSAVSSTETDNPIIVYESLCAAAEFYDTKNFQGDSNPQNLPTSSQPEASYEHPNEDVSETNRSTLSDSNTPTKQKKKPTPVKIPERIKLLILQEGIKEGELDLDQVEIFFSHAKKKANLLQIARQFTNDVHRLKEQIESIIQIYYKTPNAGNPPETHFIKWLENMYSRFDFELSKL